ATRGNSAAWTVSGRASPADHRAGTGSAEGVELATVPSAPGSRWIVTEGRRGRAPSSGRIIGLPTWLRAAAPAVADAGRPALAAATRWINGKAPGVRDRWTAVAGRAPSGAPRPARDGPLPAADEVDEDDGELAAAGTAPADPGESVGAATAGSEGIGEPSPG